MKLQWARIVATLAHLGLAVGLCFVPLFDVLGFERAFATGLLAALLSPAVAFGTARAGEASSWIVFRSALSWNLGLLLPTVLAGLAVEYQANTCDPATGAWFMVLLAGGNTLFGTALGTLVATVAPRALPATSIIVAVHLFFLGWVLRDLYQDPQIFAYALPLGFWPGSLYDESLTVTPALWAHRGLLGLWSLALLFLAELLKKGASWPVRARAAFLSLGLGAAAVTVALNGESLGFAADRGTVLKALSRTLATPHFIIHVDPSTSLEQQQLLREEHELRFAQLQAFFGRAPDGLIHSYVYRDTAQKAALMGASDTMIARPWEKEVHVHGAEVPHPVLKHELAHVFAASLADNFLDMPTAYGVLPNLGLIEGIAVAADWKTNELSVHGWARALKDLGHLPDMTQAMNPTGFWSLPASRAYTAAGSFVRWLVEQRGIETFARVYAGEDFTSAYGEPLLVLVQRWESFLASETVTPREKLLAEHRFSQASIFNKICARHAANLERSGWAKLGSGDLDGGATDLELVYGFQGRPDVLVGLGEHFAKANRLAEAQRYVERAQGSKGATKKISATALEVAGGIAWRQDNLQVAKSAFKNVLSQHLSTPSDRLQWARLATLERPPAIQEPLRRLLLGELSPPLVLVRIGHLCRQHPDDGLLRYLYGRALENAGAYPEAAAELEQAVERGLPGGPLTLEARLTWGRALLRKGAPRWAEEQFRAVATGTTTDALVAEGRDWAARAAFVDRGALE